MTSYSAYTLPVEEVTCRCGKITGYAPAGTTLRCQECPKVRVIQEGVYETPWPHGRWPLALDDWTHRHFKGWVHTVFFGWACDLLDRGCGCPLYQMTWPSNRLWRWTKRFDR